MAFLVYSKTHLQNELEYHSPQNVVLAGGGLIQSACRKHLSNHDVGWTISASEMLQAGDFSVEDHAIVIDTSPSRQTVSLFEIKSISGYSYEAWTPILLTLEQLFADAENELKIEDGTVLTPEEFKSRFRDGSCERHVVRSILYLRGGWGSGDWNWGGNSRTTAALLWEDAWGYFSSCRET